MFESLYRVRTFPAVPVGGPFLIVVGLMIAAGGLMPTKKGLLVDLGLLLGSLTFALSWKLARGLPDMTKVQIACIPVAIAIEVGVLVGFADRIGTLDDRLQPIAVLAIVTAHFLLMVPAYGPAITGLALICA